MTESLIHSAAHPAAIRAGSRGTGIFVYAPNSVEGDEVRSYARNLHNLLGLTVCYETLEGKVDPECMGQESGGCDLVVLGEPAWSLRNGSTQAVRYGSAQALVEALLPGKACAQAIARTPASILLARRPRWPIRNILLILRIENTDEAAVDWLVRLARPDERARNHADNVSVTILPLVPSVPAMYNMGQHIQVGLDVLLSPNTPSGYFLRCIAHQLARLQIEANLRLRQGKPDQQIREELAEGNYDLVLIGSEPHGRLYRLLLGEIVTPMLRWIDRPLLIARSVGSEL
jgi:nucleotide-binding universal stress UspA family protein